MVKLNKVNVFPTTSVDDFGYCHVFYSKSDNCEAIEFFELEEFTIGKDKFDVNDYKSVKTKLTKLDSSLDTDGDDLTSSKLSIGVSADDDDEITSVLFAKKGYYA